MMIGRPEPRTSNGGIVEAHVVFNNDVTAMTYVQSGEAPSTRLAVTFSSYGVSDPAAPIAARSFFTSQGWDVLAVTANRTNWFQDVSAEEFAEVMGNLPVHTRVVTYGSNMGGYGALYFAAAAGARQVIAISPQVSNDPALVPWDKRWIGDAQGITFRHTPLAERLAGREVDITVIYDPQTDDSLHVAELQRSVTGVNAIALHHGGHPADAMLEDMGLLQPALERLVNGAVTLERGAIRQRRRRSPPYLVALAAAARRHRRAALAERLLTLASELVPRADVLFAYSDVLLDNGKVQAALIARRQATAMLPEDAHRTARLAHLEEMNGDLPGSAHDYARAIQLDPTVIDFHVSEARVLRAMLDDRPGPVTGKAASTVAGNAQGIAELDRLKLEQRGGVLRQRDLTIGLLSPFLIAIVLLGLGRFIGWI